MSKEQLVELLQQIKEQPTLNEQHKAAIDICIRNARRATSWLDVTKIVVELIKIIDDFKDFF